MRITRVLSMFAAGVMVMALTLGLAGTAHASTGYVDYRDERIVAWGQIDVWHDRTDWSIALWGQGDGGCAYMEVVVDRNNRPDKKFPSQILCGGGEARFAGDVTYSGTRGARLLVCWVNINCWEVMYVREN
jgi:hypothetical protein